MIIVIKHISIEGPGIIADFFWNRGGRVKIVELGDGDKLPVELRDIEAVIILGGPMNVYEEVKFPFLKDEDRFIKRTLKEKIPILGICLGAQLLAKACGAKVKKAEKEELGWYKVDLTEEGKNDPLFKDTNGRLDVFQWHEDSFEIPDGAVLLATSDFCKNQAFRFGKNAYGFQFHIEVTPVMIESWVKKYLDESSQNEMAIGQKMLIDAYKKRDYFKRQAGKLLKNFCQIVPKF